MFGLLRKLVSKCNCCCYYRWPANTNSWTIKRTASDREADILAAYEDAWLPTVLLVIGYTDNSCETGVGKHIHNTSLSVVLFIDLSESLRRAFATQQLVTRQF